MDNTQTMDAFVERHGLALKLERVDSNPYISEMPAGSSHWLATITRDGSAMYVHFSQGPAHRQPPTLDEILDCLASDAGTVESARSFDDWADEFGYFPMDSSAEYRRALDTFQTIERQSGELRELLGDAGFEALLYGVGRL